MFPPDGVSPTGRLKAGRGKSDRLRTSRVTEGVNLSSHARRLSAVGNTHRLDGSGRLLALLPEGRSLRGKAEMLKAESGNGTWRLQDH